MKMKVLLYLILLPFSYTACAQGEKQCELLKQICENEKVQKALKLDCSATPLTLITENAEFSSCGTIAFGTHEASVIYHDSIISKGHPFLQFKDSSTCYLVMPLRKKGNYYYIFEIFQPYSGLVSESTISRNHNSYKILKTEAFVE